MITPTNGVDFLITAAVLYPYTLTVFDPVLSNIIADVPGSTIEHRLLMAPKRKFYATNRNVISGTELL